MTQFEIEPDIPHFFPPCPFSPTLLSSSPVLYFPPLQPLLIVDFRGIYIYIIMPQCMLSSWWQMASNSVLFSVLVFWASLAVIHASEQKSQMGLGPFLGLSYRDRMNLMKSIKTTSFAVSPSPSSSGPAPTVISASCSSFIHMFSVLCCCYCCLILIVLCYVSIWYC